jgi:hypothetical protein
VLHASEAVAVPLWPAFAACPAWREVVIERGAQPLAVVRAATPVRRTISECIALAKAHEEETAPSPTFIRTSRGWKRSSVIANL